MIFHHMLFYKLNLHLVCSVHNFIFFGSVLVTPPDLASFSEFISMLFIPCFRSLRILPSRNLFHFFLAVSSFITPRLIIFKLLALLKKLIPIIWQHWCCSQITLNFQYNPWCGIKKEPAVQVQRWKLLPHSNKA